LAPRDRFVATAALLLVTSAGCQAPQAGTSSPIRSRVALFRVDTSALQSDDLRAVDRSSRVLLAQCIDGTVSSRLREAIEAECGPDSTTLLPRAFAEDLDYAWDQEPTPQLAIVARLKRRSAEPEDRVGGVIVGTVGWLLIGIPGYFIDDYDQRSPIELEMTLYEGLARSDRDLGTVSAGDEAVSTDFVDRNGFNVLPYVMTILVPPHLVSAMDQDDPEAVATLLLDSVVTTAARAISERIRAWELVTPAAGRGGG